jgi:hypothetical protein
MQRATTWDLYVADIAAQHENWQFNKAQGIKEPAQVPTTEELQAMIDRARNKSL